MPTCFRGVGAGPATRRGMTQSPRTGVLHLRFPGMIVLALGIGAALGFLLPKAAVADACARGLEWRCVQLPRPDLPIAALDITK